MGRVPVGALEGLERAGNAMNVSTFRVDRDCGWFASRKGGGRPSCPNLENVYGCFSRSPNRLRVGTSK